MILLDIKKHFGRNYEAKFGLLDQSNIPEFLNLDEQSSRQINYGR